MAGLKVVAIKVHPDGNLDLEDLRTKAEKHKDNLAAFMVAIPPFLCASPQLTGILDHIPIDLRCLRIWCSRRKYVKKKKKSLDLLCSQACKIIHDNGGQVYLDGASLSAIINLSN